MEIKGFARKRGKGMGLFGNLHVEMVFISSLGFLRFDREAVASQEAVAALEEELASPVKLHAFLCAEFQG